MKLGTKQLGGILSAAVLTVGGISLLTAPGCENPAEQCGFTCDQDLGKGEFSVTGISSVDAFFKATVDFKSTSDQLAGNIKAELDGLQADFGITPAELTAGGGLAGAVKAKFTANAKASAKVKFEPAKCEVDAHASFEASASCKAEAGCTVDASCTPGTAEFECKGSCEVEADVSGMVSCGANIDASCTTKGPTVACEGSCKGECTLMAAATCDGTCDGTCSVAMTDGKCSGTCTGSCKSDIGASCKGSCAGECTVTGPSVKCDATAEAHCEAKAEANASVMCKGKCEGDFEPPACMAMAECKASANCDAQAKADASLKVECTPPSLEVKLAFSAGADAAAQAQGEFYVQALKVRLPKLLASLKKSELILDATADLGGAASGAFQGAIDAFSGGDVTAVAKYKLLTCAPDAFATAAGEIQGSTADLQAQVMAAASLSTGLKM